MEGTVRRSYVKLLFLLFGHRGNACVICQKNENAALHGQHGNHVFKHVAIH